MQSFYLSFEYFLIPFRLATYLKTKNRDISPIIYPIDTIQYQKSPDIYNPVVEVNIVAKVNRK